MTTLQYSRNGKTYTAEVENLPAKSIEYLLQYGFAQSLQDCIAGREKKVREEINARVVEGVEQLEPDEITSQVHSDIEGMLGKRLDAIVAGTVGTRSIGESRDTLTTVARDMARKALAKKNMKADKDRFAAIVQDLLNDPDKRAKVQAEFDRRKALDVEVDLDVA